MCGACHDVKIDLDGNGTSPTGVSQAVTDLSGKSDSDGDFHLDQNEPQGNDLVLQTTFDEWQDYAVGFEKRFATDERHPVGPLGCAECHDHKYDPMRTKEFYQLYAFFHNVPEKGLDRIRTDNPPPRLPVPTAEQAVKFVEADFTYNVPSWKPDFRYNNTGVRGDLVIEQPSTGRIHVAIGDPGLVETIDPRTGAAIQTTTGIGAHTTALVVPDQLYVISPAHGGILVLADA